MWLLHTRFPHDAQTVSRTKPNPTTMRNPGQFRKSALHRVPAYRRCRFAGRAEESQTGKQAPMSDLPIEERYPDVLQNLSLRLLLFIANTLKMIDYDVDLLCPG